MQCRSNSTLNIVTKSALWASISRAIAMTITTTKIQSNILVLMMWRYWWRLLICFGFMNRLMWTETSMQEKRWQSPQASVSPTTWVRRVLSLSLVILLFSLTFAGQPWHTLSFAWQKLMYFDFPLQDNSLHVRFDLLLLPQKMLYFGFPFAGQKNVYLDLLLKDSGILCRTRVADFNCLL